MADVNIRGYVRGLLRAIMQEGPNMPAHLTSGGELLVAQGVPADFELARQAALWCVVGTAVAPVAAVPTTAAHLTLFNGYADKSLALVAVGTLCASSMAVAGQAALLARNSAPGSVAYPAAASLQISGLSGKPYGGKAKALASQTLGTTADLTNWIPVAKSEETPATTTIGLNVHADVYGRWLVQPGGLFSLATLAQTAAGTFQPYAIFAEVLAPLP